MAKLIIKSLSVKQPYAEWIKRGEKTLEIRSWKTEYRGELLICASQRPALGGEGLLNGHAVCIVELLGIYRFLPEHVTAARCPWRESLYAWEIKHIKDVVPFPVKGQLKFFDTVLLAA